MLHANTPVVSRPLQVELPVAKSASEQNGPPALMLDEVGIIRDCSKSVERLFGYRPDELVWQHISCLFPQFSKVELIQKGQINQKLNFISRCGHIFMGLNKQGNPIPTELNFVRLEHNGVCNLRLVLHSAAQAI